ncbi:MAG: CBS domain-containing protein [Methylophilaceae bacterium]|jgi:CBS domain-containing protein
MKILQQLLKEKQHQETISIASKNTVYDALELMAEKHIGALVVMESGKLVGIVSERDYAREVSLKGKSAETTIIKEIMTTNLISCQATDLVSTALSIMTEKRVRHMPIMDNGGMIGILSIGDLVKETIEYQAELIEQLESYIRS